MPVKVEYDGCVMCKFHKGFKERKKTTLCQCGKDGEVLCDKCGDWRCGYCCWDDENNKELTCSSCPLARIFCIHTRRSMQLFDK